VNWTGASAIANYCVGVTQAKPGDIWIGPGHTFLQAYGGQVYEANSGANIVQYNSNAHSDYVKYSIFPQFDNEKPTDGEIIDSTVSGVDISVYIYGRGDFTTSNVSMFVNGIKETNTEIIIKSDTSVQFVAYDSTLNSWSGEVNVEVTARNDIVGNGYIDKYNWQFTINRDSTPPKVISTSPQKGEEDVPIDKCNFGNIAIGVIKIC
jgi:hypothetical protein